MRFCTYLSFSLIFFLSLSAYGQIPNNGFEQWSAGEPDGWWTNNIIPPLPISQSTDAHSGSYAVRGDVVMTTLGVLQPLLVSGEIGGTGFPVSQRHANFTGYYKLNVVTDENLSIVAVPFKDGTVIGAGAFQFFAATDYTPFSLPINYWNESIPDSMQISFTIGNNSGSTNVGSYFIVDDIAFSGIASAVDEKNPGSPREFSLEQNYPNPFNPGTTIRFTIPEFGFTSLKIYDVLGKEVATLVDEFKPKGEYKIDFNASSLPSGVYFYKLNAGEFTSVKKMILSK